MVRDTLWKSRYFVSVILNTVKNLFFVAKIKILRKAQNDNLELFHRFDKEGDL